MSGSTGNLNSQQLLAARSAGVSDTGPVRPRNEDAWYASDRDGFYLVADGVASSGGGATAARIAAEVLADMMRLKMRGGGDIDVAAQRIATAIVELGREIHAAGERRRDLLGMSAAVVGAQRVGRRGLIVFHLGDCRAYRFRATKCELLTRDHSLLNSLLAVGSPPVSGASQLARRTLTRLLGQNPQLPPELMITDIRPGDRLLLCSDGLAVNRRRARRVLASTLSPPEHCRQLLALGRSRNRRDNATAIVIQAGYSGFPDSNQEQ